MKTRYWVIAVAAVLLAPGLTAAVYNHYTDWKKFSALVAISDGFRGRRAYPVCLTQVYATMNKKGDVGRLMLFGYNRKERYIELRDERERSYQFRIDEPDDFASVKAIEVGLLSENQQQKDCMTLYRMSHA